MVQWLWWWMPVIITRRRLVLPTHILDITKNQIHVVRGILAIIKTIATGSLSCHVHRTQHWRARLPKGGCAHAGEIVAIIVNTSVTRNAHQEKDKDYLMLPIFQKYAVPYTESSPRRVTRKTIASCTFVLASDPGDLQRWFAFFVFDSDKNLWTWLLRAQELLGEASSVKLQLLGDFHPEVATNTHIWKVV